MAQRTASQAVAWYGTHRTSRQLGYNPNGMCLKICRQARNIGAVYSSALKAQNATPAAHRIKDISKIQIGHIMYYDNPRDGNPFGHIVTVVGRVAGVDRRSLSSLVVETNSVKSGEIVRVRGDYFPRYWGDQFQFAADWLNGQKLIMPAPVVPVAATPSTPKGYMQLKIAHASLQFSDTPAQRKNDINKIFAQAFHWITGTEAGEASTRELIRAAAIKYSRKYKVYFVRDTWVAVRTDLITSGWTTGHLKFVDNDLTWGRGHDSGLAFVRFYCKRLGWITIGSSHYPVKGDPANKAAADRINLKWNKVIARGVTKWAEKYGKGDDLVFFGADYNIDVEHTDPFFGGPLTVCWKDIKKYPATHGKRTIDGPARYDRDLRVKPCVAAVAYNDKQFFLNGDHHIVISKYNIQEAA